MAITINASTSTGLVQTADNSGEIELQSNGTTALKVNTNEGIQILNCLGVGNATPSTSGAGITFPATQSASTDANTLDDYEEGTWTPVAVTSGYTISSTNASYTKIGRLVTCSMRIMFSAVNASQNSSFIFSGAPFLPSTSIEAFAGVCRENSSTGAIYVVSIQTNNARFEINSMDSVATNSQRTIRTGENYICSITYEI